MSTVRQYELVYIAPPESTEEALADLHTQVAGIVEKLGGSIEKTENWGRRKLAYEINKEREGVYVLEVINGPGELTSELERRLRVMDSVMRHMLVRVDEDLAKAERAAAERKALTAQRREKRGLPPEPEPRAEDGDDNEDDRGEDGGDR